MPLPIIQSSANPGPNSIWGLRLANSDLQVDGCRVSTSHISASLVSGSVCGFSQGESARGFHTTLPTQTRLSCIMAIIAQLGMDVAMSWPSVLAGAELLFPSLQPRASTQAACLLATSPHPNSSPTQELFSTDRGILGALAELCSLVTPLPPHCWSCYPCHMVFY